MPRCTLGAVAFGQIPLLQIDGLKLVQTMAILRYMGSKYGWYAGPPAALARIDVVAEGTADVKSKLSAIKFSDVSAEEKTAKYAVSAAIHCTPLLPAPSWSPPDYHLT